MAVAIYTLLALAFLLVRLIGSCIECRSVPALGNRQLPAYAGTEAGVIPNKDRQVATLLANTEVTVF